MSPALDAAAFRQAEVCNRILELADVEMNFGLEHRRLQNQLISERRFQALGMGDSSFAQVARFMIGVHLGRISGGLEKPVRGSLEFSADA